MNLLNNLTSHTERDYLDSRGKTLILYPIKDTYNVTYVLSLPNHHKENDLWSNLPLYTITNSLLDYVEPSVERLCCPKIASVLEHPGNSLKVDQNSTKKTKQYVTQ